MSGPRPEPVQERDPWSRLAGEEDVEATLMGLRSRGFEAESVRDGKDALERLAAIIPEGARVYTNGTTLKEIGFIRLLQSGEHKWVNLKESVLAETDPQRQAELRRSAIYADYMVGSVHAVTRDGEMIAGSASGSQLAAYVYGAQNLVLVVGAQKLTKTFEDGMRRLREHSTAMEDRRLKDMGRPGTTLSKIVVLERQTRPKVHVIIVNERLGF